MPGSTQRVTRSSSSKNTKRKMSSNDTLSSSQVKSSGLDSGLSDADIDALSSGEIISVIPERNTDPVIDKLAQKLRKRISREISDAVEKEKRCHSLSQDFRNVI
ncbi:hypothetical protein ANCDUO_02804 [Ancylostoma duodenale]|uniref:Uncharacterized protein n=1 Tax=Ancylostoma duodenale TaxID=51022 RepID=A0A0C2DVK2_9BILA|nr:hypothetical protein ANCDUO_02804 [Ancylostoma duodenale]